MTRQRLRGRPIWLWPQKKVVDRRGTEKFVPDPDGVIKTTCMESADHASNAEAPGQVVTEIVNVIVGPEAKSVGSRGAAFYEGQWWDLTGPKARRWGTRHVRHYTLTLTVRPSAPHGLVKPNG